MRYAPPPPRRPQGEGTDAGSSQSRPSLRDLHSPQAMCKSTVEEDLKKLITPESPPSIQHKEKVCHQLKRTMILSQCAPFFVSEAQYCLFTRKYNFTMKFSSCNIFNNDDVVIFYSHIEIFSCSKPGVL